MRYAYSGGGGPLDYSAAAAIVLLEVPSTHAPARTSRNAIIPVLIHHEGGLGLGH